MVFEMSAKYPTEWEHLSSSIKKAKQSTSYTHLTYTLFAQIKMLRWSLFEEASRMSGGNPNTQSLIHETIPKF